MSHQCSDADAQRVAALRARAARSGCELIESPDGTFLLTRWGLVRELCDAESVGVLLGQIEGRL